MIPRTMQEGAASLCEVCKAAPFRRAGFQPRRKRRVAKPSACAASSAQAFRCSPLIFAATPPVYLRNLLHWRVAHISFPRRVFCVPASFAGKPSLSPQSVRHPRGLLEEINSIGCVIIPLRPDSKWRNSLNRKGRPSGCEAATFCFRHAFVRFDIASDRANGDVATR